MSFSSAAWALMERDKFIGWTEGARRANLQRVVCNSRFLIIPTIEVHNLASHVLSQCANRIAQDWIICYGVEPVILETFVDPQRFSGTCYRAANWIHVGKTSGRRANERGNGGPKEIFLYPLRKDWQEILRKEPHIGLGQRSSDIDEPADWVEEELGTAQFYDPRLNRRLFQLTRDFYGQPQAPITQACETHAKAKAAYRFFENKRVSMDEVLTELTWNRPSNASSPAMLFWPYKIQPVWTIQPIEAWRVWVQPIIRTIVRLGCSSMTRWRLLQTEPLLDL